MNMNILIINAGSSSLKYQLINMKTEEVISKGNCERIGSDESVLLYSTLNGSQKKLAVKMQNHTQAFEQVKNILFNKEDGVLESIDDVFAIGHRVVQGGNKFSKSTLINNKVISEIKELIPLAPLHNSANLEGIIACREAFGENIPQVAVFDTAFHSTIPEKAFIYPIPYEYYEKYQIRRYGFHGTSHKYVSERCAELMEQDINDLKIITCHLGSGSSICAVNKGESIDTSMGFTPVDGFMMGTRSGTLDPSIITFIQDRENKSSKEINNIINQKSGLLGISGISNDIRDVTAQAEKGHKRSILAQNILHYEIAKFIGSYIVALSGCDAIVFTAGLGENQPIHREAICKYLKFLGVNLNKDLNYDIIRGKEGKISSSDSNIPVFVIPTNEELVIARDTKEIVLNK